MAAVRMAGMVKRASRRTTPAAARPGGGHLDDDLATLSIDELRDLVRAFATDHPGIREALRARAALARGDVTAVRDHWRERVDAVLTWEAFDDESSWLVHDAWFDEPGEPPALAQLSEVLADLEREIDAGCADVVAPVLLHVLDRLHEVSGTVAGEYGWLDGADDEPLRLFVRACREGDPPRVELGRWLAKYRLEYGGLPVLRLQALASALGEEGVEAFRAEVCAGDEELADEDPWSTPRADIDQMLVELADHDSDVDAAVARLGLAKRPDLQGIIDRYLAFDRLDDAVTYVDRAVAEEAVGLPPTLGWGRVEASTVVDTYLAVGRADDAVAVARGLAHRRPMPDAVDFLLEVAERVGRREAELAGLIAWIDGEAWPDGAAPIALALHLGDVALAWTYADRWGAGVRWRKLADAVPQPNPVGALELYRSEFDQRLPELGRPAAQSLAGLLARIVTLADAADRVDGGRKRADEVLARIRQIRAELKRRRALIEEMDRAGLPT